MRDDVWLDISDAGSAAGERRLTLSWCAGSEPQRVELSFQSPYTPQIAHTLAAHVREFRSWRSRELERARSAGRTVLQLGRALGSSLCDTDLRLLALSEQLEHGRVKACRVSMRSDDPQLMAAPWEALILPDSSYVLAAAAAAFVRAPAGLDPLHAPARELRLEAALGYVLWDGAADARVPNLWSRLRFGAAVRFALASCENAAASHIVHIRGELPAEPSELLPRLRERGTSLLLLEPLTDAAAADAFALRALREGIDNVVILAAHAEHGWPSDWAEHLLERIVQGLGVQQAVIETRKHMQRVLIEAQQRAAVSLHGAEPWFALRHYSARDVVFFSSPQPVAALDPRALREGMSGFDALQPQLQLGDRTALRALSELTRTHVLAVSAAHGGGLTHCLHRAALVACVTGEVQHAYYWDFERERFSARDLLEMVSSARGQSDPAGVSEESVCAGLPERRELFVFDNVEVLGSEAESRWLLELCERLAAAGGLCLLGTHGGAGWQLPALSETERVALIQAVSPAALALAPELLPLADRLRHAPLVLRLLLGRCTPESIASLGAALEGSGDALSAFYAHAWRQLESHWRKLARAWLAFDGLYLELLMVAVDQPGERSEPARRLWWELGAPDNARCADGIAALRASGFARTSGGGTTLERAAQRFLRQLSEPALPEATLAGLVCEGVVRVLERGNAAMGELIASNLIAHRALLCRQVELTLQSGQYALGTRAFVRLHGVLQRARLREEARGWAGALIEGVGQRFCTPEDPLLGAAWLSVALRAPLRSPGVTLQGAAQRWAEALTGGELDRALIPLATSFLEAFFDSTGDAAQYRTAAHAAARYFRETGVRDALVGQLTKLAAAEHVLGNTSARDALEQELLDARSYGPEAEALRQRTVVQVAMMRLRRGDDQAAQAIVDGLDGEAAHTLLLRAELALYREQWELAAAGFCSLWRQITNGVQGLDIDAIAAKLQRIEQQLGAEHFARVYTERAAQAPTPAALGIVV